MFISTVWPHAPTRAESECRPIRTANTSLNNAINKEHTQKKEHEHLAYLAHRSLYVSDDGAGWVIKEFHSDLGHVTSVSGATKHLVDLSKLYGYILKIIGEQTHVHVYFIVREPFKLGQQAFASRLTMILIYFLFENH